MTMHRGVFRLGVGSFVPALLLALAVLSNAEGAQAQAGCEYERAGDGLDAGNFVLDCSHAPAGKDVNPNPDGYLAIAMSPNMAAGYAWGPVRANAERTAMASCKKSGGTDCRVVESYLNMCAAIAISNPKKIIAIEEMPGQGWNPSELARRKCSMSGGSNCHTIVAGCAGGYMSPTPWMPPARPDGTFRMPTFSNPSGETAGRRR
jgi:hypothetical protein